jgi:hypothetical protein
VATGDVLPDHRRVTHTDHRRVTHNISRGGGSSPLRENGGGGVVKRYDGDRRPKLLLIAPHNPSLPEIPREVMSFINTHMAGSAGYEVYLLQGDNVDEAAVAQAVTSQSPVDVIWLATHGDGGGVLLSRGKLSIDSLTPYVRTACAKLVVFNTCESVQVANLLMQEADVDVIATIRPLGDQVAGRTAALFARNLLQTGNYREAYEKSQPGGGNRDYVYLSRFGDSEMSVPGNPGNQWSGGVSPSSNPVSPLANNERLLAMMERTQSDVGKLVTDVEVLKARMATLERDVSEIKQQVLKSVIIPPAHNDGSDWRTWLILIVGVAALIVVAFILLSISTRGLI